MRTIRRPVSTALGVAAALAATACAGDRSTAPQVTTPLASAAVAAASSVSCDPTFARQTADAHAFFASASDPAFASLQSMQTLYQSGGPRAATNAGFDVLDQVASARLTSRQGGTAADGDALTKDVLVCMSVGSLPSGFSVQSALSSGVYEVRGGTSNATTPALAQTLVNGGRGFTSPIWGIEPVNTWGGQFESRQTRFLVYGAPLPVSSFSSDPATRDPNNVAYTGFDISTIPAMPRLSLVHQDGSAAPVRVGICIDPATGPNPNLLVHAGATDTTILRLSTPLFCGGFAANALAPQGVFARLARSAMALVTPTPAYALLGGVGGLPSGLSPFGPVTVSVDDITLTFTQQPSNGWTGTAIKPAVLVQATTANGTPIGGVIVRLHVLRADGSDAGITAGTREMTSDVPSAPGIARFGYLVIPQPGTYTLLATGSLDERPTLTTTSVQFTVQRK